MLHHTDHDPGLEASGRGSYGFEGRARPSPNRPGLHAGKGPKGYRRSQERLLEDVCERLTWNGDLDASNIEVSVDQDEVTLEGTVDSRQAKRMAETSRSRPSASRMCTTGCASAARSQASPAWNRRVSAWRRRAAGEAARFAPSQRPRPVGARAVYGKNLSRVMRDVAAMVRHGKKQAAWLLRLRTARDRWRWFRIHARPASLREPLRHDAALSLLLEAV